MPSSSSWSTRSSTASKDDLDMSLTELPVALLAGFISFLAPCVLPLVPGYLSAISAIEADRLGERGSARRIVAASLPFVLGFTVVFVLLGVAAQLVGDGIARNQFLLEQIAGLVLVVFGLAFMGLLPWPDRLVGAALLHGVRGRGSRVALGGAFAVCAAPCVGPVLAATLVLAGSSDTVLQGALLLAVYSLGLAIPFVLAGALFTRAMGMFRWLRDHYTVIRFVSGTVMVALGLLLFFERFYMLRIYLNRLLERLGIEPSL
jgi:cytochrome c-type biogenesis protein